MSNKFDGSGFGGGSGFFGRNGSASGGKKPRKFDHMKCFGKYFGYFVAFLFFVAVAFFSGFFGSWLNNYFYKNNKPVNYESKELSDVKVSVVDNSDVEALVAKVLPSVVGVVAPIQKSKRSGITGDFPFSIPFFPFFSSSSDLNRDTNYIECGKVKPFDRGDFGSGFFVNIDGQRYVVTNYHVIKNFVESENKGSFKNKDENVYLVLQNNYSDLKQASVVGYDVYLDVAVLKPVDFDVSKIGCLEFASKDSVKIGGLAVAIGNPSTIKYKTVTRGIVSCLRTLRTDSGVEVPVVQTDAAVNSGSSGGPLLNGRGEVIGINTAKSVGNSIEGTAFAVSGYVVHEKVNEIVRKGIKNSGVDKPKLGITVYDDESILTKNFGVVVGIVEKDSAAEKAGIEIGDFISKIDDVEVKEMSDLQSYLCSKKVGDEVVLTIIRKVNGSLKELKVKVVLE